MAREEEQELRRPWSGRPGRVEHTNPHHLFQASKQKTRAGGAPPSGFFFLPSRVARADNTKRPSVSASSHTHTTLKLVRKHIFFGALFPCSYFSFRKNVSEVPRIFFFFFFLSTDAKILDAVTPLARATPPSPLAAISDPNLKPRS